MNEEETLAAEYALDLLDGADLLSARTRLVNDPLFAASVTAWEDRLAPLFDEIEPVAANDRVWHRIEAALAEREDGAEVVTLRSRVRVWQAAAFAAAAAAGIAIMIPVLAPGPADEAGREAGLAPLVASVPIANTSLRLAVTYLPDREELLVSAAGVPGDGVHDHELWLVPRTGDPLSLGVVRPDTESRVPVDRRVTRLMNPGARLVLTREPLGGAPQGGTAGPAVGQGVLAQI